MSANQINRINYYNILAMFISAGVAIVIPFELVLLSYAILGPGHYLTEISWLKGRQFFTRKKHDYLIILLLLLSTLLLKFPYANVIYYTFGFSCILLLTNNNIHRMLAVLILVAAGYFLLQHNILHAIFGLYIPTLIHVYLFTGAFILAGALKGQEKSSYITFAAFLLCPLLLCVVFTSYHYTPTGWAMSNYRQFAALNKTTLRNPGLNIYADTASIILTRIIAFAYTYHYINWFSKTRIIKWHKISVRRALIIATLWAAFAGLYFYNYRFGLQCLFLLSLLHVVLEFPLNQRSFVDIGRELKSKLRR